MSEQDRTEHPAATPALDLAGALAAIAQHLVEHPHLSPVNITRPVKGYAPARLQIAGYAHLGEQGEVPALLAWAQSFDDPKAEVYWHDEENRVVTVDVTGTIDGHLVRVWAVDEGDLYRWRTGGKFARTPITVQQLAAYVAAGTVEQLGEHAAAGAQ